MLIDVTGKPNVKKLSQKILDRNPQEPVTIEYEPAVLAFLIIVVAVALIVESEKKKKAERILDSVFGGYADEKELLKELETMGFFFKEKRKPRTTDAEDKKADKLLKKVLEGKVLTPMERKWVGQYNIKYAGLNE